MPVLVTAADTALGRAAVEAFLRTGGQVRAWVGPAADDAAAELRALGAKVARGELDDEGRLETALEQVHTVVHLAGGPLEEPGAVLEGLATVLSAALGAGCRRLVWPSWVGADAPGGNAYLEACAEAEAMLADAPLETVVVRRGLTYGAGDDLTAVLATRLPAAARAARHAPLPLGELVRALVVADRRERAAGELHLVVEVVGSRETTLDGFADWLGEVPPPPSPQAQPAHLADLLARDTVGGTEAVRAPHAE